jgi:TolA-binding protein
LVDRLTQAECTPEIRAHALFLQGQLAATTQRWDAVAAPLQELLEKFPDSPLCVAAKYWTAEAHYQQKDYESAGRSYAELDPDKLPAEEHWGAMVLLRRAQIQAEQQKWQEAYDLANGVEERFPDFPQQYEVDCLLGRCLAQQRKFADAVPLYERAVRSPQGGRTETAAMSQWLIGEAFAAQLDLDQALKAYYRVDALFDYPSWRAAALVQAGKCHELKGENVNAANAWGQVVAKYPNTKYAAEAAEWLKRLNMRLSAQAAPGAVPASRDEPVTPTAAPGKKGSEPARSGTAASGNTTEPAVGPVPSSSPRSARRRTISQP